MYIGNVPNIILSCCILHNIYEVQGDVFNEGWLEGLWLEQPEGSTSSTTTKDGGTVRNLLVNYLGSLWLYFY